MVASQALPRWVKIAGPQGYAKSPGLPPVPGEGEGRAGRGRVRSGFHHLPGPCTFLPPTDWIPGGGTRLGWRPRASRWAGPAPPHPPTEPLGGGQGCPARGVRAGGQQLPPPVQVRCPGKPTWPRKVLTAAFPERASEAGAGSEWARDGGSREVPPQRSANCSTRSAPQVTFHRGDRTRLCRVGPAPRPLLPPPQG